MAYISAEQVKVIRNDLKKAFPKIKFSVRKVDGGLSVNVKLLSGPDFGGVELAKYGYAQVNQYWIDSSDFSHKDVLHKVKAIVTKEHWDHSNAMIDHFSCSFYYHISIGDWNKPYKVTY